MSGTPVGKSRSHSTIASASLMPIILVTETRRDQCRSALGAPDLLAGLSGRHGGHAGSFRQQTWHLQREAVSTSQYVVDVLRTIAMIRTCRWAESRMNRMRQLPTRRRHSAGSPWRRLTSPTSGLSCISSIAALTRATSAAAMRLSDRRALGASATAQLTLHLFPTHEAPLLEVSLAEPGLAFLLGRDQLVLERDVLGANRLGRQGRTLGGGRTPDRHVGNSGEEEPVAFYHRVGKGRAARGGCQGDDRGPETPRATGLSAGPRRTAGHAAELSAMQVLPRLPREARSEGARKVAMLEEGAHIGVVSSQAAHRRMTTGEASAQHRPHQPRVPHQMSAGATP